MKTQTYEDAAVVGRIRQSYVAASINGPRQPDLARKLGVQVYPTTVILSPDARVLDSIRGYVPPAELQERLTLISNRLDSARR
jgi:thioredoxin-like negative regulator of GroEL